MTEKKAAEMRAALESVGYALHGISDNTEAVVRFKDGKPQISRDQRILLDIEPISTAKDEQNLEEQAVPIEVSVKQLFSRTTRMTQRMLRMEMRLGELSNIVRNHLVPPIPTAEG